MGVSSQIKRYVPRIVVLVLVVSVALNVYDHFFALPQIESTMNNMRVEAFKAWRSKMGSVRSYLNRAETNIDIKDIKGDTYMAERFANIFTTGINIFEPQKELYQWVSKTAYYLDEAMLMIYSGNQTGVIIEQPLDENILTMIQNVTTTIENLRSKTEIVSLNGVDPAQQLREAGVLSDILKYLEQIYQVSVDMHNYYWF